VCRLQVLQEVVCDALGALEGTMLQHMGTWADDSQRRLTTLEGRLEHDAIRYVPHVLPSRPSVFFFGVLRIAGELTWHGLTWMRLVGPGG
jgi:hypothetical protein